MAMRVSLTSESSLKKKKGEKKRKLMMDRISELPDEILHSILSRVKAIEAARTSVLSHRWKNLWTGISNLDFYASEKSVNLQNHPEIRESERLECATWVNQVLNSHQAPNLEGFRICLNVTDISQVDIDSWIGFAIKKRVQRLELDFSSTHDLYQYKYQRYGIPANKFCFASFKSLTFLSLKKVDLAQELFDHLLSNSPFLQHLCVHWCRTLVNLKVATSPSSILKYLEISDCEELKSIETSSIYLESFKYTGKKATIFFKEAPLLIEVLFKVRDYSVVMDMSRQLSRYQSQLRKIVWSLNHECDIRQHPEFPKLPTFRNLRHLELRVMASSGIKIHPIMSFLEASPFIHIFKLELNLVYFSRGVRKVPERNVPIVMNKRPYLFLKIVELIGFVGAIEDLEIAMYLLENAVSLEKLIISPSNFRCSSMPSEIKEREKRLSRECAIELGTKLPPGAEFLML